MWWWSWLLTAFGVFGLWLAGRGTPWGWAVGLGAQGLWVTRGSTEGLDSTEVRPGRNRLDLDVCRTFINQ